MPPVTPDADHHTKLTPLASRPVDVAAIHWAPTRWPGIHLKVLMGDKDTGLPTALTKFDNGAVGPRRYILRPGGPRRYVHAPNGSVVLPFFLKPSKFFDAG